jgi:tRNA-dihydrouridine synthase A
MLGLGETREQVEALMCDYMVREAAEHGTSFSAIARHMLGLRHGLPGSRRWRSSASAMPFCLSAIS